MFTGGICAYAIRTLVSCAGPFPVDDLYHMIHQMVPCFFNQYLVTYLDVETKMDEWTDAQTYTKADSDFKNSTTFSVKGR